MPKVNKISKLPSFRVVRLDLSECERAPFYPEPEFSQATASLIKDQLLNSDEGIAPFWGIAHNGLAQIFLGAYQLSYLKSRNPQLTIPVRVAEREQFTTEEIARLMLHPSHAYPESDVGFRARTIEGLRQFFALSDQQLANFTDSSRSAIANARRLLKLEPEVLEAAQQGRISYTIARELLSLPAKKQIELAKEFGVKPLSTQQMMARIHGRGVLQEESAATADESPVNPATVAPTTVVSKPKSNDTLRYEQMISEAMGYPAEIVEGQGGRGQLVFSPFNEAGAAHVAQQIPDEVFRRRARMVLDYDSFDELDAILAKLFPPEEDF
ncbi:ParB/RepB/Spo0J family partition protein [Pseudomaricurvus sp.]|uniref:ParB/RepB/Spo0J family partition protein n=1 Tax=Pseudomaricurvus sp. TaxID=2004510 RepID=UPI003F6ADFC6